VNSRHRDRIVDREVMKLELRAAKRRSAESDEPRGKSRARPRAVLVAVELNDDAAAAATVAAAGLLADALGAEVILAWGAAGPAIVDAARQEQVDLVVVSMRGGADHYVLHHSEVPVLVVPVEPPANAAA
jgi:nucleotide-binding universal stress UspA family protein